MKSSPKTKGIITEGKKRRFPEEELKTKEAEYRMLFEDCPISLWVEDFSGIKKYLEKLRASGIKSLKRYFDEHPEEVIKCASMARISDVNKATLIMYQAKDIGDLRKGLNEVFNKESYDTFKQELVVLGEGKTRFEAEAVTRTLKGKKNYIKLKWSVAPGFEKCFSKVLVSIIDLTDHRELEERLRKYQQFLETMVEKRTEGLKAANQQLCQLNRDLGERIKELNCLYGISKLAERQNISLNEMLRCVVNLIPSGYRYPDIAGARILFKDQEIKTDNFRTTKWEQSAGIVVRGEKAGRLEVCYLEEIPGIDKEPFLAEEEQLIEAITQLLGRIAGRLQIQEELKESEKRLRAQKKALEEKNIALREIMEQLEIEKKQIKNDVVANVDELLIPQLMKLKKSSRKAEERHIEVLRRDLDELASSFGRKISDRRYQLTPREIEICNMIKSGLTNKEMARLLRISQGTVERHRENVRKKLGIAHEKVNLISFLQSF